VAPKRVSSSISLIDLLTWKTQISTPTNQPLTAHELSQIPKVRYQLGLVNLTSAPLLELGAGEAVL
jgi:hypothetical protein